MVENQTGRKLKCLRTDNGGEFKFEELVKFCRERGIQREYTTPYSPELNEIVERMNGMNHSGTRSIHAPTLRTIGWLLGKDSTHGSTHNKYVAK